jgi:hypothetical protein
MRAANVSWVKDLDLPCLSSTDHVTYKLSNKSLSVWTRLSRSRKPSSAASRSSRARRSSVVSVLLCSD